MTRLREIARITMKEARGAETPENQAWLVWRTLRTSAEPPRGSAARYEYQGVMGWRMAVSLNQVILALWPEWAMMEKKDLSNKTQPLYAYLKTSGNAKCLNNPGRDHGETPVWWFRDEWFGGQAIVVPGGHTGRQPNPRSAALSRREARLTPEEAGEDRVAEPVVVTKRPEAERASHLEPGLRSPEHAEAFAKGREEARERKVQAYRTAIIEALIEIDDWIGTTALAEHLGVDAFAMKRNLDALVNDGLVERGRLTRHGTLYRAAGVKDKPADEAVSEPGKSSVIAPNPDNPTSSRPAASDGSVDDERPTRLGAPPVSPARAAMLDPAARPVPPEHLPKVPGLGDVMERINTLIRRELAGLDIDTVTRERDAAVSRVRDLEAEVGTLRKKLEKFRTLLED